MVSLDWYSADLQRQRTVCMGCWDRSSHSGKKTGMETLVKEMLLIEADIGARVGILTMASAARRGSTRSFKG